MSSEVYIFIFVDKSTVNFPAAEIVKFYRPYISR